jgi:hypothetical protein
MKKLILLLLALALAPVAFAQTSFTNGVKGTALPAASTPLSGAESVFLIQSGTTKTATVSQLNAAAVAQNNGTSNTLASAVTLQASANIATSNTLSSAITANASALVVASNNLASAVSAASAQATTVSNSVNFKLAGYYGTNNAAGYQTAAQVSATAAAAAAAAAAGIVSSNGAAAFGSIISSNTLYNVFDNGQATAKTVNLGTASMQTVEFTNVSGNSVLSLTGYAAGQNVTIVCFNNTGSALTMTLPVGIKNLVASAATLANIPTAGVVVFNILSTTTSATGSAMSYSRSY